MRILLRYFLWLLSALTLLFFYLLNTSLGHRTLGYFAEGYLSKKTYNEIEVHSLNLEKYPHIVMDLTVNHGANLLLKGKVDNYSIDMDYHLKGDSFTFNNFHVDDKIDIYGTFYGPFSKLLVEGKGEVFDGNVIFGFTRVPKKFQDMNILLSSVDSQKVLKFLNKPIFIEGKVDIDARFKSFSKYKKRGESHILMVEALMPLVAPDEPFTLDAKVDFDDIAYKYEGRVDSKIGNLTIQNGEYQQAKGVAKANYLLKLNDLAYFEKLLKHKYIGSLDTNGSVLYDDKLHIEGYTHKFGGNLEYVYEDKEIDLKLKEVYLERLLVQFSYPTLLRSNVSGTINYDMKDKIILMDTKLEKTRFVQNKITSMIQNTIGIDLLKGEYNQSTFKGGYQNQLLSSELKIDDGKSHLYLLDTKMNASNNKVDSKFELKMQGQEIYGNIYGTLKEPKVSVDMSRLLKYQMNKKMGEWFGTQKSEEVKNELKHVPKDVVKQLKKVDMEDMTDTAKSLIDGFFK